MQPSLDQPLTPAIVQIVSAQSAFPASSAANVGYSPEERAREQLEMGPAASKPQVRLFLEKECVIIRFKAGPIGSVALVLPRLEAFRATRF